jgi:hypothetical protein
MMRLGAKLCLGSQSALQLPSLCRTTLGRLGKFARFGARGQTPAPAQRPGDILRLSPRPESKLKPPFPRRKFKKNKKQKTKTNEKNLTNANNNNPTCFVFFASALIFIDFHSANLGL